MKIVLQHFFLFLLFTYAIYVHPGAVALMLSNIGYSICNAKAG